MRGCYWHKVLYSINPTTPSVLVNVHPTVVEATDILKEKWVWRQGSKETPQKHDFNPGGWSSQLLLLCTIVMQV